MLPAFGDVVVPKLLVVEGDVAKLRFGHIAPSERKFLYQPAPPLNVRFAVENRIGKFLIVPLTHLPTATV